jgi:hypothetical protein
MSKRPKSCFTPAEPFSITLYSEYDTQNMFLAQVKMPSIFFHGDKTWEVWADRLPHEVWTEACPLLRDKKGERCSFHNATEDSLLAFGQRLCDAVNGPNAFPVTGLIVIRFTNAMTGYPTYRITMVSVTDDRLVYTGAQGPNIRARRYTLGLDGRIAWQ